MVEVLDAYWSYAADSVYVPGIIVEKVWDMSRICRPPGPSNHGLIAPGLTDVQVMPII